MVHVKGIDPPLCRMCKTRHWHGCPMTKAKKKITKPGKEAEEHQNEAPAASCR